MNISNGLHTVPSVEKHWLAASQVPNACSTAEFITILLNPDSQRCPAIWSAKLQAVEANISLRLSTFIVVNGFGLGSIPLLRKEHEVSGFGG